MNVAGLFQMSSISDIIDSLGINVILPPAFTLPPAMTHMAQSAGDDDDDSR